jgi:hypothetical protein
MGRIFTLTPQIRQIAQDCLDDLIDQLGKDCRLEWPPQPSPCPNCISDPAAGVSLGIPQPGAQYPFPDGAVCPVCGGTGSVPLVHSRTIRLLLQWGPGPWSRGVAPSEYKVPYGAVLAKGRLTDLPDVLQSRRLVAQLSVEPLVRYAFELDGMPIDTSNIVQNRYFSSLWRLKGD